MFHFHRSNVSQVFTLTLDSKPISVLCQMGDINDTWYKCSTSTGQTWVRCLPSLWTPNQLPFCVKWETLVVEMGDGRQSWKLTATRYIYCFCPQSIILTGTDFYSVTLAATVNNSAKTLTTWKKKKRHRKSCLINFYFENVFNNFVLTNLLKIFYIVHKEIH